MSNAGVINIAGGGGGGAPVQTLTGNSGGAVPPTANNINIVGNGPTTVVGSPGTSTLTVSTQLASAHILSSASNAGLASFSGLDFSVDPNGFVTLVGGAAPPAIQNIFIDESSGGGSDPIFSDPSGNITITGALVNFGTHAKAVSTNSATNPDEFTIDVQIANTAVASTRTANGLSHFDSAKFTINTDGFVSLSGTGSAQTLTGNSGTATPSAGNINVVTANATVKFVGSGATLTQDFALTNVVLGSSLPALAGGTLNVGLGFHALNAITSGQANTAVGYSAGLLITTATANTAVGEVALANNVSSSSNTAVGQNALGSLLSGSGSNLALGISALTNLGTGTRNIILGSLAASAYTTSESSNIIIGNAGVITESNIIRIGTQGSGVGQQTDCYLAGILHTSSGITRNVTAPGAYPYTVLSTDDIVSVSTAGAARTINLPNAPTSGTVYVIKDVSGNAAANNISVTTLGGVVTIDGATTYTMNSNYSAITVYFNGTSYFII